MYRQFRWRLFRSDPRKQRKENGPVCGGISRAVQGIIGA